MPLLIVDDEKDCRDSTGALLRHAGYDVLIAESGEEALDMLKHNEVSAMLVDMMMPGMTGEELIKKAWDEGIKPPALLVTAIAPWKTSGLTEFGVGYVRKPFNADALLDAIETLLKRKGGQNGSEGAC